MLGMTGIGDNLEEVRITGGATDILGWTGSGAGEVIIPPAEAAWMTRCSWPRWKRQGTTIDETKRRGRLPWSIGAESTSSRRPSALLTKRKAVRQQKADITEVLLTRGQVNTVRAAFKAGITPSRIARQFGISQSNVRKALASEQIEEVKGGFCPAGGGVPTAPPPGFSCRRDWARARFGPGS